MARRVMVYRLTTAALVAILAAASAGMIAAGVLARAVDRRATAASLNAVGSSG